MIIKEIWYDEKFKKELFWLPSEVQKRALKAEKLFAQNAFHPSLRLHKLKGKFKETWSISIDLKNRIIFKIMPNGTILFISIGSHAIYED